MNPDERLMISQIHERIMQTATSTEVELMAENIFNRSIEHHIKSCPHHKLTVRLTQIALGLVSLAAAVLAILEGLH